MQFCFINCLPQQSHLVSKCSSCSLRHLLVTFACSEQCWERWNTDLIFFLATECKFAPANLLGEQTRPASRCFEYIQLEFGKLQFSVFALNEIYPALASLYRLWSGIPITRNLVKNYTAFWIRRVWTPKNNAKRRYFSYICAHMLRQTILIYSKLVLAKLLPFPIWRHELYSDSVLFFPATFENWRV